MKKFKENNPIDIIEALCQMGNTENVGIFEMPWSKAYPEIGLIYTPGFYLYSYNEELPTNVIDTYTMKVEIQQEGLDCNTEIYLYYIGD